MTNGMEIPVQDYSRSRNRRSLSGEMWMPRRCVKLQRGLLGSQDERECRTHGRCPSGCAWASWLRLEPRARIGTWKWWIVLSQGIANVVSLMRKLRIENSVPITCVYCIDLVEICPSAYLLMFFSYYLFILQERGARVSVMLIPAVFFFLRLHYKSGLMH